MASGIPASGIALPQAAIAEQLEAATTHAFAALLNIEQPACQSPLIPHWSTTFAQTSLQDTAPLRLPPSLSSPQATNTASRLATKMLFFIGVHLAAILYGARRSGPNPHQSPLQNSTRENRAAATRSRSVFLSVEDGKQGTAGVDDDWRT